MNKEVTSKTRNWFITINRQAECFDTFVEKIKGFEKAQYSYILHDKDAADQPHYHLCILFENGRTFETMQKHFPGAHIEIMESKYKSFRYLLHLDDVDKYQYDIVDVVERGNNVSYYSTHDEYIKLDTESVLENISNGTIRTLVDAVKLFGVKQTNVYKNLIKELIELPYLEKDYTSEKEVQRLNVALLDKEEINLTLSARIAELTEINNKLLVKIRKLEEYEKICNERGLI